MSPQSDRLAVPTVRPRLLLLAALVVATLVAYQSVWHGGLLWDDEAHITKPSLQSLDGLRRIWLEPGATQQYYPVVHSAFWLQQKLWGAGMPGYHAVNIILHAVCAFLLAMLLGRLSIPGAWLAAFVFALHPIQVESVAWVSELKNTLSGVFVVSAALVYLRFDATRRTRYYVLATALFVVALLSKTVTSTLPAALLVIIWWQRGRVQWRRDILPLAPLVALGVTAGLLTAWFERTLIGAQGAEFDLPFIERCLVAGRAIWFYLATIMWPADLSFNYPRWNVSGHTWWQYLYPVAAALLVVAAWRSRKATRAPLAVTLLFVGLLFPALGFFNVFPFRYSFVADHFAYLATMPVAAAVGVLVAGSGAAAGRARRARTIGAIVLCATLGALTWNYSKTFADSETLYRATLARNASSWLASNNLGFFLLEQRRWQEAETYLLGAVRLKPDVPLHHANLGLLRLRTGDNEAAVRHLEEALRLDPNQADVHTNLGLALLKLGRLDQAHPHFVEALRLEPGLAQAQNNLGYTLVALGRPAEALPHLEQAIRLLPDSAHAYSQLCFALTLLGRAEEGLSRCEQAKRLAPDFAEAYRHAGIALSALGRFDLASRELMRALDLAPGDAEAHYQLGLTSHRVGRLDEAIEQFESALRLAPNYAFAHNDLGAALRDVGRTNDAMVEFAQAIRLRPDYSNAHYNLATALHRMGRLDEAVLHYRRAFDGGPRDAATHHNLGVALEELGRKAEAADEFREALRLRPGFAEAARSLARVSATR